VLRPLGGNEHFNGTFPHEQDRRRRRGRWGVPTGSAGLTSSWRPFFPTALKAALPPIDGYIEIPPRVVCRRIRPRRGRRLVGRLLAQKDLPNVRVERPGAFTVAGSLAIGLIDGFEGLPTKAYRDVVGVPTVCFGETRRRWDDLA
jgi:hypothetical protein